MQHLFSADGLAALASTLAQRPLLAFDFDGTLAPIVPQHDDARVPPAVALRLDRLARILPLAIISGRSIDDLRSRLSFEPRYTIGNHGAEDPLAATGAPPPELEGMRQRLHADAAALRAAGVSVEDKRHSISLHYRLAPDHAQALELITGVVKDLHPDLVAFGGKLVMNIAAAAAPDKAHAVAVLVERSGAHGAVFVGDDINDEPVFARAEPDWLTIKIGRDQLNSQARFYLDSLDEVASMLDRMLVLLGDTEDPSIVP